MFIFNNFAEIALLLLSPPYNEEPSTQKGEVMPLCLHSEQVTDHYWSSDL